MGIIVSIPQIEGPATGLSASLATDSISHTFDPAKSSKFEAPTTVLNTEGTFVSSFSAASTGGASSAEVADVILVDNPKSLVLVEKTTTYDDKRTVTVTSEIMSPNLITTTATVLASSCPSATAPHKIISVPSTGIYNTSTVGTLTLARPLAASSLFRMPPFKGPPENSAHVAPTSILVHSTLSESILSRHTTSPYNRLAGNGARSTDTTRIASTSDFGRRSIAVGGSENPSSQSDYTLSIVSPSIEITKRERPAGIGPISTIQASTDLKATKVLTKTKDVVTTTVYTSATTVRTTTTTVTALPKSCPINTMSTPGSAFPKACTSATPNTNPPTGSTCAEDGLLEYSSTFQPPDTLEGCAVACLADASCLSFTFIPSEMTCYTSLYPLADSAFAGVQEYHIYNYDRGCYSCSS